MIEDLWRLFNSTNEWVRFADAKAGGALAGSGVLAGALASAGLSMNFASVHGAALGFAIAAGVSAVLAAGAALYALAPTLRINEPATLIYFEHVAREYGSDPAAHAAAVKALLSDEDRYCDELASQVWANSLVAHGKFVASGWALTALGVGVFLAGVAAVIVLA